ncbi:MAG TPA: protein kinase [Fimbriiglobus sp.]|jgi:tetratricopeptide (TPR) repeat protein|nr:protein kinase [Fimbriiglobus sp.]
MTLQRLGDFEILREIGRGGMGVVYEVRQTSLNRRVALKVLSSGMGLTPKAVHRFHREAEAAAKLHHTNIVPIYATGEEKGTHFFAMELVEGPSLDHVIRQLRSTPTGVSAAPAPGDANAGSTPLSTTAPYVGPPAPSSSGFGLSSSSLHSGGAYYDTVAQMVAEVADALDYAHQQGVIHRDVKPSNLLLSPAGRLSVSDFGLARLLEQPGVTITGEMVGTPRYMSPEQITAGRIPVDHRTDIYSLGATLYQLLTLRPPFAAEHRDQLLAQVIQKEPARPRRVNPKVPVDLETICLKAMEKDPDRRYQTAGQMADDLRRYVNRFAILARRVGPVGRLVKWSRRNPALAAALAGVLVCAAVAGGLAYRAHLAERDQAEAKAKHDAELLEEQRRSALEKAMLLSRVEDFDGARQAIREAEKLGCSAGQIRMLQGQLELYQGHVKEAIDHLTQATELMPETVAAWGMLAVAHNFAANMNDYHRALDEVTRRPAVTAEDYLFRGHAESVLDPDRGLASLEEALRLRPSALARLVHLDVLRVHVLDSPDEANVRLILNTARSLRRQFPENAMMLSLNVSVCLTCYHVFAALGRPDLQREVYDEGTRDALALGRYPNSIRGVVMRWTFLDETGQSEAGLADLRRAATVTKDQYAVYYYARHLYRSGEYEASVKVSELGTGEVTLNLFRAVALAETSPDGLARANRMCEEVAARDLKDWDRFNAQLLQRLLGRKPEAVEASQRLLDQPERWPAVRREPFKRALEYCAGRRSPDDLITSMGGKRCDLCNAHLCVALTALADGDRATAKRHLRLCVDTRFYEFIPYDLAQMLLSRMAKDEAWPPWIPPKP